MGTTVAMVHGVVRSSVSSRTILSPSADRRSRVTEPGDPRRAGQRGQALVLFVLMAVVMIGAVAIVTDVSWLWYGQQRMQRAADAAALAGAVYLPGNPATAYATARAEATKNGFTDGSGGVSVTPIQDPTNRRRIIVTITGPSARSSHGPSGISNSDPPRPVRAEYVLPGAHGQPRELLRRGLLRRVRPVTDVRHTEQRQHRWVTGTTWTPNGGAGNWTKPNGARLPARHQRRLGRPPPARPRPWVAWA